MTTNTPPESYGYQDIADLMKVKVETVRSLRTRDENFPAPTSPPWQRSPSFNAEQIAHYIKSRADNAAGQVGRPPNARGVSPRITTPTGLANVIHAHLTAKTAGLSSTAALAASAGMRPWVLAGRLRDETRWTVLELAAVAAALGREPDELLADGAAAELGAVVDARLESPRLDISSRRELAARVGMKQAALGRKLGGAGGWRIAELEAIASALRLGLDELLANAIARS